MLRTDDATLICPNDGATYHRIDGIWRCLPPERTEFYANFIADYEKIRAAEGRNQHKADWYAQLPYIPNQPDWRIRARSYETLMQHVIQPRTHPPLTIADFGAGNGWLSHRLASDGHCVSAVDLLVNTWDGLGAHQHYPAQFVPVQAEFDHVPYADSQFDILIYNGAFHYSTHYQKTLREARRLLKPGGVVVIMDTPVYHDSKSGGQMVAEREAMFQAHYGTKSNHLPAENYLTYQRLTTLQQEANIKWRIHTPNYGLKWTLKPVLARLRGHREPAKFHVICGEFA